MRTSWQGLDVVQIRFVAELNIGIQADGDLRVTIPSLSGATKGSAHRPFYRRLFTMSLFKLTILMTRPGMPCIQEDGLDCSCLIVLALPDSARSRLEVAVGIKPRKGLRPQLNGGLILASGQKRHGQRKISRSATMAMLGVVAGQ